MRRFLITSNRFTGQAELTYTAQGVLCRICATDTDMDQVTVKAFKSAVPESLAGLLEGRGFGPGTTIVEADYEVSFETFYQEYPLKRNRYKAEKVWSGLSKNHRLSAWNSLKSYKRYCSRNSWYTPMTADNYLRNRHFETDWNKV